MKIPIDKFRYLEFFIEDDYIFRVYKDCGGDRHKQMIMPKETFIEAFEKWIKPTTDTSWANFWKD